MGTTTVFSISAKEQIQMFILFWVKILSFGLRYVSLTLPKSSWLRTALLFYLHIGKVQNKFWPPPEMKHWWCEHLWKIVHVQWRNIFLREKRQRLVKHAKSGILTMRCFTSVGDVFWVTGLTPVSERSGCIVSGWA